MGRKYTQAEIDSVTEAALQSIATGQSLNSFCIANKHPYKTVSDWLTKDDAANSARARAVELGTHYLAGECLDIADNAARSDGIDGVSDEDALSAKVALAKLKIDTRMRLIGKWNRKDYGESSAVDVTTKGESLNDGAVEFARSKLIGGSISSPTDNGTDQAG